MAPSYPASTNSVATNNFIASGLIAGFLGLVVALSLLCVCCFYRSRAQRIRAEARSAVIPRSRVVVQPSMAERGISPTSRVRGRPSIAIPQKSIPRNAHSRSHDTSNKGGILLRRDDSLFSSRSSLRPSPCSSPRLRTLSILNPAWSPHDRSSSGFSMYSSVPSPSKSNSRLSSVSFMFNQPKPVRQLFERSLPDELEITRCGEYLTMLQSFDDGWCLVARDKTPSGRASYLSVLKGENVDIGLVPSWVFAEPIKGSIVTRPFRGSSINALHTGGKPNERGAVPSWSFFA